MELFLCLGRAEVGGRGAASARREGGIGQAERDPSQDAGRSESQADQTKRRD